MSTSVNTTIQEDARNTANKHRNQLLGTLPVREKRLELAGISTALLEGGEGPPMILLHGPGENAFWWMQAIPLLANNYRVIVPDLPGHGASHVNGDTLDAEQVLPWLNALIEAMCTKPPVLVGHVLGGAIAARFAIENSRNISRLVLVDSLGLGNFRPSLRFAFGLFRFMMRPTEKNYNRFLPHCMFDLGDLRNQMGRSWEPFLAYNLDGARNAGQKAAMQTLMKKLGVPKIPSNQLAAISIPVDLIWGRHDKANKLQIAERAGKKYGWPLHVIDHTRDDPKLERPKAFSQALHGIVGRRSEK